MARRLYCTIPIRKRFDFRLVAKCNISSQILCIPYFSYLDMAILALGSSEIATLNGFRDCYQDVFDTINGYGGSSISLSLNGFSLDMEPQKADRSMQYPSQKA